MSKHNDILGSLVRVLPTVPKNRLGLVLDFSRKIGGAKGSDWEARFKCVLREKAGEVKGAAKTVRAAKRNLLTYVTTIQTVAIAEFRAATKFIEGQEVDGVRTDWMSEDFKRYVLPLVRNGVPAENIRMQRLERKSRDHAIRKVIGKDKEGIEISQFFQVLAAHNEVGTVIVAYIKVDDGKLIIGSDGEPLAVYGHLCSDGWIFDAVSVEYPHPWSVGNQFCSR